MFTSGYVNKETILHFFYKITNERGTKTVFTYAHIKWFYGQSERADYLNYFINSNDYLVGAFSRALGGSFVFTLRFHWIFDVFSFLLTLVLVLRHKIEKNFVMLLVMIRSCFADCLRTGSVHVMMYCKFTKKQGLMYGNTAHVRFWLFFTDILRNSFT